MIGDIFQPNKLIEGIEGHVTVEVRDETTGKLQAREETHNFISLSATRYLRWVQRNALFKLNMKDFEGSTPTGALDKDYQEPDVSTHIALTSLTDDNSTAGSEWTMYGKLIGYSNKTIYNQTGDPLLGSPQIGIPPEVLCETNASYTKWTFDWDGLSANGTIGSVGWVGGVASLATTSLPGASNARFYISSSLEESKATSTGSFQRIAKRDNNTYYLTLGANTSIYQYDQNLAQVGSGPIFSVGGQFKASTTLGGIAWDRTNNRLWVIGLDTASTPKKIIAAYDPGSSTPGTPVAGPFVISNSTPTYLSLTHDGTNLWTLGSISNNAFTMYKINPSDGVVASSLPITLPYYDWSAGGGSGETAYGISYEPTKGYLYVATWAYFSTTTGGIPSTPNSAVRAFDLSGNEVMVPVSMRYWIKGPSPSRSFLPQTDFEMIDPWRLLAPDGATIKRILLDGMGSRAPLGSAVTKSSGQTLRITYQMTYV